MKILVVAATEFEIAPFCNFISNNPTGQHQYQTALTGIGLMHTAFSMQRLLAEVKADFIIQAGVAGAYNEQLALGSLVAVHTERLGDLGIENRNEYLDIFESGLIGSNEFPYKNGLLVNELEKIPFPLSIPTVKGLSVNTVSGCSTTIENRARIFNCDIETMEGAAFHYACLWHNIPFLQIRSISNYVEPRDKNRWKMQEAIVGLNDYLIHLTEQ
jgi:futalosine hydrolase